MLMRSRLFWKILFGFWVTFICIAEGVWLIFSLSDVPRHRADEIRFEGELAESMLGSAASAIRLGGERGLRTLLSEWPETERARLTWKRRAETVESAATETANEALSAVHSRIVSSPGGAFFQVSYNPSGVLPKPPGPGPFNFPPELISLGVLGGLLFSALLAWYLSTPIWRLRAGFNQLAGGALDVRLKQLMGRRRDEIADLAREFDLMAERMQSLVESRERLLYDVSHELRSPLARQHMAIGLARQNPQRTAVLLDRIEQESSRMDDLVGELLTLSRVEAEENGFDEYFDLQGLVRVVVNNTRFEAESDGVRISLDMAPEDELSEISTVRGDAELVRRALENVMRNALRHSPRESSVTVTVFVNRQENSCTIQVQDSGPGVPNESLKQIFEPFVRLGTSERRGAGLGLSIAKRAMAVHGGSIEAANRETGGLCITIVLPIEPPE